MKRHIHDLMQKGRYVGQTGFTLIEVLIGVSILTVGILGVATMQISAIRGNHFSDNTTTALILAEQRMEELLSKPFNHDDLENAEPTNDNNLGSITTVDYSDRLDESGALNANGYFRRIVNIADDNPLPGNKAITVMVTWRQDKHKVSLTSIKRP